MLSNHAYNNANRLALKNNRENERRLLEEFERISSDKHRPNLLPHSIFSPHTLTFDSPMLSCLSDTQPPHEPFTLDFNSTHSPSLYAPFPSHHHAASLHVDHTGNLLNTPNSPWLTPSSSLPESACASSTSLISDDYSRPLSASVAAAAVTAAIIVVPHNNTLKRPRSPSSFTSDAPHHHHSPVLTDNPISDIASSEDPASPRTIQHVAKPLIASSLHQHKNPNRYNPKTHDTSTTSKISTLNSRTSRTTISSEPKKVPRLLSAKIVTDAESSRKRRAEAMERFRRKKAVRCYARRVRYQIRKRIATTRPRVNGRFARRIDAINHASKVVK